MRFRFNATMCVGAVLALFFPVCLCAQGDTRITDSLLFSLQTNQSIRVRLAGGAYRSSAFVRVEPGTSRLTLNDGKPSIDPEAIDLLYVRAGRRVRAGTALGAGVLAVGFAAVGANWGCTEGCAGHNGVTDMLAGAIVGATVGAVIGGAIGAFIPNWRLQFSRSIRPTVSLRTGSDYALVYATKR